MIQANRTIKDAIKKVKHAVAPEGIEKTILTSIHAQRTAGGTYIVATDGYRLAYTLAAEYGLVGNFNCYGEIIQKILKNKDAAIEAVPRNINSDMFGSFPEWTDMLPDKQLSDNLTTCVLPLSNLHTACRLLLPAKSIRAIINQTDILVLSGIIGEVDVYVNIPLTEYRGSPEHVMDYTIKPIMLFDFCEAFKPTEQGLCTMKCNTPITPVFLEHDGVHELIMPMG